MQPDEKPMLDDLFHALSNPTRGDILRLLNRGSLPAGEIAAAFPSLAVTTMSSHCKVLKSVRLVVAERRGTSIVYHLNLPMLEDAARCLLRLAEV